ncbi:alpha/beta-hydrolase [Byssothecium circinans]|uniref:Alpha/beta-hydrolase n=1 Tax=Byssothecium circinans TaxID=147558 RepID=A0A6A5U5M5_9PLEO|nr:alpha/beta-hydrolase [Byssothecium circinans]
MSCDKCKEGFRWDGTPIGKETTLAGLNTYVTGTSKTAAILIVHDIFGWTANNSRLLADQFAELAGATVWVPDFFGGEVVAEDLLLTEELREKFNIPAFIARHNKEKRYPEISAAAKALKAEYPKLGAVGYCYGGWAVFKLGNDPALVDAVVGCHPSMVEKSELDGLTVATSIHAPEEDFTFLPDMKEHANKVIPTLGIPYEYVHFPGLQHGFASRGDRNNKKQADGMERSMRGIGHFFTEFLH